MKALDLHPEDLLDKASRGELDPHERSQLDEHLSLCDVCRVERSSRVDFETELGADASPGGGLALDDLVTRALSGAAGARPKTSSLSDAAPDPTPDSVVDPGEIPGLRRRASPGTLRALMVAAAAAAILTGMGGVATAARYTGVFSQLFDSQVTRQVETPQVPATSSTGEKPTSLNTQWKAPDRTAPENVATPTPTVEATAIATAPVSPVSTQIHARQLSVVPTAVPSSVEIVAPTMPSVAEPAALKPEPSGLFAEANHARARGDHVTAVRGYRDLQERFPSSPEARLSRVTLGRLLLDRGDASAALAQLDAYLTENGGALREDALTARAVALSKLGRRSEEAAAWRELVDAFPGSIHASRAHARLAELGSR